MSPSGRRPVTPFHLTNLFTLLDCTWHVCGLTDDCPQKSACLTPVFGFVIAKQHSTEAEAISRPGNLGDIPGIPRIVRPAAVLSPEILNAELPAWHYQGRLRFTGYLLGSFIAGRILIQKFANHLLIFGMLFPSLLLKKFNARFL